MELPSPDHSLIDRAKAMFQTDPWAAKAMVLTAKTLFSKDFLTQFEAYMVSLRLYNVPL